MCRRGCTSKSFSVANELRIYTHEAVDVVGTVMFKVLLPERTFYGLLHHDALSYENITSGEK